MASRFISSLHDGFLFHVIRLCRLRAASEKVARGFALGILPHFFPTFGFGAIISAFFARTCGGNGMAGLISGILVTPLWPFFFYINVRIGSWLLRDRAAFDAPEEVTNLGLQKAEAILLGRDFSVGAMINSVIVALAAYLLLLAVYERARPKLLTHFRERARWRRRTRRLVPVASVA
jgi:uncharacterized protein (DUF2062 family)